MNLALILYQQALSMYRDEIGKVLAMTPKVVKDSFWIPPEWYKNVAMIHFRMANHGGRQLFHSFKLARVEMEKFVHFRYFFFLKINFVTKKWKHLVV